MTGPVATRMVLSDPLGRRGGAGDRRAAACCAPAWASATATCGAVLNVKSDHLGLRGIDTLEELAEVKRIVVEVARDTAVLNADDPLCLKMADYTEAKHLCYVTMNPTHELVRRAHPRRRPRRGAGGGRSTAR